MTNFIFNSEINFLNKYYDKCFSIFKLKSYFKFFLFNLFFINNSFYFLYNIKIF